MPEPIVFISRNRVRPGKAEALASALTEAVAAIGAAKPRTALFAAYRDAAAREVRIVHAFSDAAAAAAHFEGSAERSRGASELIEPIAYEIYGPAPASVVDQLRREAAAAGIVVDTFTDSIAGYLRPPA